MSPRRPSPTKLPRRLSTARGWRRRRGCSRRRPPPRLPTTAAAAVTHAAVASAAETAHDGRRLPSPRRRCGRRPQSFRAGCRPHVADAGDDGVRRRDCSRRLAQASRLLTTASAAETAHDGGGCRHPRGLGVRRRDCSRRPSAAVTHATLRPSPTKLPRRLSTARG